MDYESRLSISFYREVAVINQEHLIFLVQHIENHKFYVKKILDVYNIDIYRQLKEVPVQGLPKIFDLYEDEARLVVIEEYIPGETLEEYVNNHGCLSEDAAFHYIIQLCDILSQLHHLTPAIIHRDIKPSNIMLTPYQSIVLLDLNTAKYVDTSKNADTMLLGTKGFAAPEQYGFGSSSVLTDIYGTGVLLNTLLTGTIPSVQMTSGIFAPIVKKCTQLRPEDRYQSIDALKKAILKLKFQEPPKSTSQVQYKGSCLPPGYRSKNILHMLIATLGYGMIFSLGSSLEFENATPTTLVMNRTMMTLGMLFMVFFSCNYRNMQSAFPFCASQNRSVHAITLVIYNILIFAAVIFLMILIESLFM